MEDPFIKMFLGGFDISDSIVGTLVIHVIIKVYSIYLTIE
jgi:hypothetical protein